MKDENKTKKQLIDELAELRGRKDAFQEIAEQSADIICTTDLSGRITYWSPGGEKLLGYAAEDALGNRVAGYYQGGDEEARALMVRLQQEGQILNYELTLRKKDGGQHLPFPLAGRRWHGDRNPWYCQRHNPAKTG